MVVRLTRPCILCAVFAALLPAQPAESPIRQELRALANSPPVAHWQDHVGAARHPAATRRCSPNNFGARGDGQTPATKAIQAAIDSCSSAGGGMVEFAAGRYVIGSLFLKANVDLHLAAGVELLGAEDDDAFPMVHTRAGGIEMDWRAALLNVRDQQNVSITGPGTVNARGSRWWKKFWDIVPEYQRKGIRWAADYDISRPHLVQVYESRDVTLQGLTFEDSPFWTVDIAFSRNVTVDGVTVRNNISGKGPSTDGINIDSSAFVIVQNCDVDNNDDNFSFKSGMNADGLRVNIPVEYSLFRHNVARKGMGVITFGSDLSGGIRHVEAEDMQGIGTDAGIRFKSARIRGGVVEDVVVHNVRLEDVGTAIVADLNWFPQFSYPQLPAGEAEPPPVWRILTTPIPADRALPHFRNITITDVRATNSRTGIRVVGIPEAPMEQVILKRIHVEAVKAGSIENARDWTFEDVSITGQDGSPVVVKNSSNVPLTGTGRQ
jgi:Glycosyl hydrolases family 28